MNGRDVRSSKAVVHASPRHSSDSSDSGESAASLLSRASSLRESMGSREQGGHRRSSKSLQLNFNECSVDIAQPGAGKGGRHTGLCTSFRQLCGGEGSGRQGLLQSLELYGWTAPNKLQQHLVPVVLQFLGHQLDGRPDPQAEGGKGCIVVQGPPKVGKTSSVILSILAAIDPSIPQPQAILVSRSSKLDIDKYLRVFALMHTINYQSFSEDWGPAAEGSGRNSADVAAARAAHILVGQPWRILRLLSPENSIALDAVKVLVIDDAQELMHGTSRATASGGTAMQLVGLPSASKPAPEPSVAPEPSLLASPTEDVVQICNLLDLQHRTCNGEVRHLIISEQVTDSASRRMLKMLKSSLMNKKDLFSVESCPLPTKLIKSMRHYYAIAPRSDWVRIFAGLVQSFSFPRALVYCDNEHIDEYLRDMQGMGVKVSANLPGASDEARKKALQDFNNNKTQFLLSHSEPGVCQAMLPKISCIFHFGVLSQMPTMYGVRLLPIDERLAKESTSILLVSDSPKAATGSSSARKSTKNCAANQPLVVPKLEKLFGINFTDMPREFLPCGSSTTARPRR